MIPASFFGQDVSVLTCSCASVTPLFFPRFRDMMSIILHELFAHTQRSLSLSLVGMLHFRNTGESPHA